MNPDMNQPNMADLFGRVMEMQRKMAETQEALAAKNVTAEAGGGMVRVTANGIGRIDAIKVEKEVVDPDDLELLEDLLVAGINKALEEAEKMRSEEVNKAAGSFLPPGMDLPGMGL
jgi:nucleoid-associated protein EbfC